MATEQLSVPAASLEEASEIHVLLNRTLARLETRRESLGVAEISTDDYVEAVEEVVAEYNGERHAFVASVSFAGLDEAREAFAVRVNVRPRTVN